RVDSWQGPWTVATAAGGGAYTVTTAPLQNGVHILYAFAGDGQHATASGATPNPGSLVGNVAAYVFVEAASADLAVTKTATPTAAPGSNVVYTVGISNGGPSDARSVTLTDPLPASTRFV